MKQVAAALATKPKPKVLVVEDDEELRSIVAGILEEAGYGVLSASNGHEALQLLVNGDLTPSLILLDLRMPIMDGWEFARVVRYYHRLADIPIVVISTPSLGAKWHPTVDGVLPKPFSPRALIAEVEKHAPLDSSPSTR